MTRRARHRLRIAVLVIISLLFQQAALAGYVCPGSNGKSQVETQVMAAPCADTGMAELQDEDNPTLCEKHCNPDHTVVNDTAKPSVPPLCLPPLVIEPVVAQSVSHAVLQASVPIDRSDPPPRLRFCSLLI